MRRTLQALFEAGDAVPGCFDFEVESGKGGGVAAEAGFGRLAHLWKSVRNAVSTRSSLSLRCESIQALSLLVRHIGESCPFYPNCAARWERRPYRLRRMRTGQLACVRKDPEILPTEARRSIHRLDEPAETIPRHGCISGMPVIQAQSPKAERQATSAGCRLIAHVVSENGVSREQPPVPPCDGLVRASVRVARYSSAAPSAR